MTISLVGLDKAEVLAALYNASKPQGMGFLQYDPKPMTREEAVQLLQQTTYFDYVKGRVMKVDLSGDELDPRLYDRGNGSEAAARAIEVLRSTKEVNPAEIATTHRNATLTSARETKGRLGRKTTMKEGKGIAVMHLGLDDVAEPLNAAIDEAVKDQKEE